MRIFIINSGSSSLKYQLIDMTNETVLTKGICERIGLEGSFLRYLNKYHEEITVNHPIPDHTSALKLVLEKLIDNQDGVISSFSEISAIGHRVVHGGEYFQNSVLIDKNVLELIKKCIDLAPLHNPANIMGIEACEKLLPGIPMVAVFDTAFHQTMPKYAYLYALPYEMYEKYKIRRYGFHGTSHKYVASRLAEITQIPTEKSKIITCHLGNGASICAIDRGKSIDTSMGFTPLEGLVMGTRSGTIDPAIIAFLVEKEKMGVNEITNLLNKKSGILGISGISNDFRDIQKAVLENNERARLALDIFCYRVKKYIGSYTAVLNGLDFLAFTGGIGENDWLVREKILTDLDYLGIKIDLEKNKNISNKEDVEITKKDSKVRTFIIHTNEELMIARETLNVIQTLKN